MGDICLMQIYADYRLMLLRNPTNLQQPGLATERRAESIFNLSKLKSDASDAGTSARRRHYDSQQKNQMKLFSEKANVYFLSGKEAFFKINVLLTFMFW